MSSSNQVRVLFSCSGIGIYNRGIESFFREAFDGLKSAPSLEARLIKGAGASSEDEWVVPCLPRTGRLAGMIGKMTGRSAYAVEQWTTFPWVVAKIRKFRPEVIFYSDANLAFLLRRFRRQIGVPFRLLFSNGGPCRPPFDRHDGVQQVAPFYLETALQAGEPTDKHFLVPYGIRIASLPKLDSLARAALRRSLNQPVDRPVILSVGWIARQHKRMDYVIEEVASLPEPRPFLQLLGAMDEHSPEIIALARERLGEGNFQVSSVPYEQVGAYYQAADVFVLGSLQEGFGRVYLEALMHGLPTLGHRHPVIEYVLGDVGRLGDFSQPGGLAALLPEALAQADDEVASHRRQASVRQRFGWENLQAAYVTMFQATAQRPLPA